MRVEACATRGCVLSPSTSDNNCNVYKSIIVIWLILSFVSSFLSWVTITVAPNLPLIVLAKNWLVNQVKWVKTPPSQQSINHKVIRLKISKTFLITPGTSVSSFLSFFRSWWTRWRGMIVKKKKRICENTSEGEERKMKHNTCELDFSLFHWMFCCWQCVNCDEYAWLILLAGNNSGWGDTRLLLLLLHLQKGRISYHFLSFNVSQNKMTNWH